jgi:hypothetical protein
MTAVAITLFDFKRIHFGVEQRERERRKEINEKNDYKRAESC